MLKQNGLFKIKYQTNLHLNISLIIAKVVNRYFSSAHCRRFFFVSGMQALHETHLLQLDRLFLDIHFLHELNVWWLTSPYCTRLCTFICCKWFTTLVFIFMYVSIFRVSTCFAILSAAILITSTMLALVGHCVRGNKMLIASGLYAIGGKYYLSQVHNQNMSTTP